MLLPRDRLGEAYGLIKEDASQGGCSILILVAPEPDALASLRLLTYLLRVDNIPFTAKAVSNYEDVKKCREQLDGGEIRSVVMINCGAVVDVRNVLELGFDQEIRCFIIDSHRPVHLANLYAPGDTVLVFDDGTMNLNDVPSDGEGLSDDDDDDSESNDEFDEDEEEDEDSEFGEEEFNDELGEEQNPQDNNEEEDNEAEGVEEGGEPKEGDEEEDKEEAELNEEDEEKEDEVDHSSGDEAEDEMDKDDDDKLIEDDVEVRGDDEDNEKEGDDDEDDDDEDEERLRRKRKVSDSDDDEGEGRLTSPSKRSAKRHEADQRRERRRKIKAYYEDASHALPSSFVLFDLCVTLSRSENDQVWLACLGITDFYVHHKMTEDTYLHLHSYMCSYIQKLNNAKQRDSANSMMTSSDGTQVPIAETGTISSNDELKFMHFRHWSLYDSMYFSPYVSSRLSVWKSNGKARLHELFAKLGVSLEQCKQKWCFLPQQSQTQVMHQIKDYSSTFDLPDLNYKAFQRCVGFSAKASASDVVYATTALLEAPRKLNKNMKNNNKQKHHQNNNENKAEDEDDGDDNEWVDAFWTAYDALSVKDSQILQKGIDLSMRQQKEMVSRAVGIIEKRTLVTLKHFRYSYLQKSSGLGIADDLFTQPIALTNLAQFLVEIHRQNGKWIGSKARPLLLLAEKAHTFLVVGVTCPDVPGSGTNKFGKAFKHALNHCNASAQVTHTFESSVMEVKREDVHRFLEALHYIMN